MVDVGVPEAPTRQEAGGAKTLFVPAQVITTIATDAVAVPLFAKDREDPIEVVAQAKLVGAPPAVKSLARREVTVTTIFAGFWAMPRTPKTKPLTATEATTATATVRSIARIVPIPLSVFEVNSKTFQVPRARPC